MRNKLVILSKKLGGLCFFGMFAYFFMARQLGFDERFAIVLFAASLFFFGMMALPARSDMRSVLSWLFPAGMTFAAIGILLMFVPLEFFGATLESGVVIAGAIAFFSAIGLMFCALLASMAADGGSGSRHAAETGEIEAAFADAVRGLGLSVRESRTWSYVEYQAAGKTAIGDLWLKVRAKSRAFSGPVTGSSVLTLRGLANKAGSGMRIEHVNGAFDFGDMPDELRFSLMSFIKEKQLDYFNFRLNGLSDGVRIEVAVALEEKEAWLDYLELIKKAIA